MKNELYDLLSALLDDSLEPQEEERLGELLRQSPEAQKLYLEYCRLHADLSFSGDSCRSRASLDLAAVAEPPSASAAYGSPDSAHGATGAERGSPAPPHGTTEWSQESGFGEVRRPAPSVAVRPPSRGLRVWLVASVIASLALVFAGVAFLRRPEANTPVGESVGEIVQAQDSSAAEEPSRFAVGQEIPPGLIELPGGQLTVRMRCGAELHLIGPAAVDLLDAKAVRLLRGRLVVEAPDEAVGFRVLTPTADMVDLGTEFGVEVLDDDSTEVHVFRGVVAARPLGVEGVIPIHGNEAGRISPPVKEPLAAPGELIAIDLNRKRFGTTAAGAGSARSSGQTTRMRTKPTEPLPPGARIVFLGDKATSHETHLLLINQAFCELPDRAAPRLFNSAIGFEMQFTEEQFQKYVLAYRPTHAVLEFGPDIAPFPDAPTGAGFQQRVVRLVDRLEKAGIEPILETGYPPTDGNLNARTLLDQYNRALRHVAAERGYRLADVVSRIELVGDVSSCVSRYNVPTYDGYRLIADCLLEAMGYSGLHSPDELQLDLLPGVIRRWKYRVRPVEETLSASEVTRLQPDETWLDLSLPQEDRFSDRLAHPSQSFGYQSRSRGFARHLFHGEPGTVQAIAHVEASEAKDVFFNTGATLKTIWLNGQQIYRAADRWTGWHPGKERVPAQLRKGDNVIVVESGNSFFLSVTDTLDWPLPRYSGGQN